MSLYIPAKRLVQPVGQTFLDRNNPLTKGLAFAYSGHAGDWDYANNVGATARSGTLLKEGSPFGVGYAMTAAGQQYLEFADTPAYGVTGPLTLLWYGKLNATTGAYRCFIEKSVGGVVPTPFDAQLDTTSGKVVVFRCGSTSYTGKRLDTTLPAAGVPTVWSYSHAGGTTDSSPSSGFMNRIPQTIVNDSTNGNSAITTDSTALRIGRRQDNATQLDGVCWAAYVWNRYLSDTEHLALHNNPWQIFQPARARVYAFPASAAASFNPYTPWPQMQPIMAQ